MKNKKMTDKITLELTLDELKALDKNLIYDEETKSVFNKVKDAYPQPKMRLLREGEYAVVSYNNMTYYRLMNETSYSWWIVDESSKSIANPYLLVMIQDAETEKLLDGLYYNDIEVKKETAQERGERVHNEMEEVVRESVEWCEENQDKDPLEWLTTPKSFMYNCIITGNPPNGYSYWSDWYNELGSKGILANLRISSNECKPTLKTPEETAESLKEAFREAQQTEKWKEIQKKIDDGDFDDFIERTNLLDFLKDKLGYSTDSCYEIVDAISEWLPETQSADGSQNVYVECTVEGWNDCINAIRGKLQ